jgi:hypothetical protein
MVVHVPLPAAVKNVIDLKVSKGAGEAGYAPGDRSIEWRLSSRQISMLMANDRGTGTGPTVSLYGTVVGRDEDDGSFEGGGGPVSLSNPYDYEEEDTSSSYQAPDSEISSQKRKNESESADKKRIKQNKVLMPSCATVSFSVKGWLPSGIKVESLSVDQKRSKGLGAGVQPYKGVKYVCVSRKGVESRT